MLWSILVALLVCPSHAQDTLSSFRPSLIHSEYGTVSEVEFASPLVELDGAALAHHLPGAMRNIRFAEPVWVIAYRTTIVDHRGAPPSENYLCHTFLADQHVDQHPENELKGIYSDAFTPEVRLPPGYGVLFTPRDRIHWMPMFNNRGLDPVRVAMKVVLTVIRAADLTKPLTPLYGSLRSVQVPHLFFVAPGKDIRETTFALPFNGRIHFLGTHLHPYGATVELFNVTRGISVWVGRRTAGPESAMQVYSNQEGFPIRAGDQFKIIATYENPTEAKIDAMAGLFMLYSRQ